MSEGSRIRVLVVGAGAVGTLAAAALARAAGETEVILAGREVPSPEGAAHLEAIAREGVAVSGAEAYRARPAVRRGAGGEGADLVLFAVKAAQAGEAAAAFAAQAGPSAVSVILSNGLDVCEDLPPAYARERVVRGLVDTGADLLGPGRVRQSGEAALTLTPAAGERGMEAVRRAAGVLVGAGFRVEINPDLRAAEWRKAAVNAVINPLGALLGLRNGELLEVAPAARLLEALAGEAQRAGDAQGIALDMLGRVRDTARATAANRNSMWKDLLAGRPTEIEEVSGRFIRRAEAAGVPVPLHRAMALAVRALEEGGRRARAAGESLVDRGDAPS